MVSRRRNQARLVAAMMAAVAVASSVAATALEPGDLLGSVLAPVLGPVADHALTAFGLPPAGGYSGFSSGTILHAGLLSSVAAVDVASSSAGATTEALSLPITGEFDRAEVPALPDQGSYGRGAGLSVAVGLLPGLVGQTFGAAEAKAPPSTALVEGAAAPVSLPAMLEAGVLRGRAQARSATAGCVLGSNLAYGQGEAGELALLGLAGVAGLRL